MRLTAEHKAIMEHAIKNGLFCGDSPEMQELRDVGFMEFAGKKSYVPDSYFRCTSEGKAALNIFGEIDKDVEIIHIDSGSKVFCDDCNKDFTESKEQGGLLFQSKAIGPCCKDKWVKSADKYNEQSFIRSECPDDMAFADWVRNELR